MLDQFDIPAKRPLDFIPDPGKRRLAWVVGGSALTLLAAAGPMIATTAEAQVDGDGVVAASAVAPEPEPEPDAALANTALGQLPALDTPKQVEPDTTKPNANAVRPTRPKKPSVRPMTERELRVAKRDARALRAPVADGRIKRSKLVFAMAMGNEGVPWAEAAGECRALAVGEVTGWRLPSRAELRDLGRAGVLSASAYWSRSRTRDPDAAFVYTPRNRRTAVWLKQEPTASTICVRRRPDR